MRKLFELMTDEKNPIWMWLPDNSVMFKFAGYLKENNVEIVPRGEWKYDRNKNRIYCTCCKKLAPLKWDEVAFEVSELISDFCPNCGAKMIRR